MARETWTRSLEEERLLEIYLSKPSYKDTFWKEGHSFELLFFSCPIPRILETRAESIAAYGHPFVKTPNLDALAAQGTLFKQAHVLHTQCAPSRCAMITGRYMHVLGHRTQTHLVRDYEPNFFRYLKEAGYTVIWYVIWGCLTGLA